MRLLRCYHRKFLPLHAGAICNILFQQQPSNDVICPSESLLLKCRVKDKFGGLARTIWKAGANCTLVLPHVLVNRNHTDECESGMFEAQLRSRPTRNCYISILRTTETPEHGTVIACLGPTESNMVDNYTVSVAGMWQIDLQATNCSWEYNRLQCNNIVWYGNTCYIGFTVPHVLVANLKSNIQK